MVLLRVQFQELLNPDVGKAERVRPVPLIIGGVYLRQRIKMSSGGNMDQILNINLKSVRDLP